MQQLISKIQFSTFESGEFILTALRSYDQLIALIEIFPWEKQHAQFKVGLCGPSITIETSDGRFLKLSWFYNRKFILYFLNGHNKVFQKVLPHLEDSYFYIKKFYEQQLDLNDFKIKSTWSKHNDKYFVSKDFIYAVSFKSAASYLFYTSWFVLLTWWILPSMVLNTEHINAMGLLFAFLMLFIFGGINFWVFLNYYFYARDKVLMLSKGNDLFYFGSPSDFKSFNKSDISKIIQIQHRGTRSPLVNFALFVIEFKDGTLLQIPNIFMQESLFGEKFESRLFAYKSGNILVKRNRKISKAGNLLFFRKKN
jgi:hypothetical protein